MRITLPSPPSADVQLPPYARRLDVRATRAAFAAGTLGTVGDNAAREDAERHGVARDADRCYLHDVQHRHILTASASAHGAAHTRREAVGLDALADRRGGPSPSGTVKAGSTPASVSTHDFTEHEALRQSRLRRWQTTR